MNFLEILRSAMENIDSSNFPIEESNLDHWYIDGIINEVNPIGDTCFSLCVDEGSNSHLAYAWVKTSDCPFIPYPDQHCRLYYKRYGKGKDVRGIFIDGHCFTYEAPIFPPDNNEYPNDDDQFWDNLFDGCSWG